MAIVLDLKSHHQLPDASHSGGDGYE